MHNISFTLKHVSLWTQRGFSFVQFSCLWSHNFEWHKKKIPVPTCGKEWYTLQFLVHKRFVKITTYIAFLYFDCPTYCQTLVHLLYLQHEKASHFFLKDLWHMETCWSRQIRGKKTGNDLTNTPPLTDCSHFPVTEKEWLMPSAAF